MDSLGFTNCPIQLRFNTVLLGVVSSDHPAGRSVFRAPPVA